MFRDRESRPWVGMWIWPVSGLVRGRRPSYAHFRRTFSLSSPPVSARVRISADNRYKLYVNGVFACRGPARCDPRHQCYDEIDLSRFLHRGVNCLSVLAHHYGESTFQSVERGGRGFLLDGEVICRRGKSVPLHTGGCWLSKCGDGYSGETSAYTVQLGFQEDFDGCKWLGEWHEPGYDDRSWTSPGYMVPAVSVPYEHLEARGIPLSRDVSSRFAGHTGVFTGLNHKGWMDAVDIGSLLADERHGQCGRVAIRDISGSLVNGRGMMVVSPTGPGRFHSVVLDAGRETCGFVHFDLEGVGGEVVDFFFCEQVRGDGTAICRASNGALCSIANRYRCRPGRQHHEFFAWQGFRYVLVVFRNVRKPLKVHHIGYTFTSYPVERLGRFGCSDELLNRIWETGVYTQQLCMHDAYIDCPWREQAQWWGDARIQWRVNLSAFGDHALMKRGIRQCSQSQTFQGLTYGLFPCEEHSCILPDYTLVWICSIWDYWLYSGDDSPVRAHYSNVEQALSYFEGLLSVSGVLNTPPGLWLFIDWSPLFKAGHNATFSLQYLEALQTAVQMARHLGRPDDAKRYGNLARRLEKNIVRLFWDRRGRQFFEGYRPKTGQPHRQIAQHANAYAILTGVQKRYHSSIAERLVWIQRNFDRLASDNTGGQLHTAKSKYPIASSFFYAYVLQAMFNVGRGQDALDGIRKLWGRMLDNGATTWYESWNHGPENYGNSSACHAWSASPTYHLSQQVGGITPASPGYDTVRIAPRMYDLDWAETVVPTRHGPVGVDWKRKDTERMALTVRIPPGAKALIDLPGRKPRRLSAGTHNIKA